MRKRSRRILPSGDTVRLYQKILCLPSLKAIRFFKNKLVEDWSLLGTLPNLEYVDCFANQRISSLWDMSGNTSLTGLCIKDFSRLSSIEGIATAPALKEFIIGNAIWDKMVIESLMPLAPIGGGWRSRSISVGVLVILSGSALGTLGREQGPFKRSAAVLAKVLRPAVCSCFLFQLHLIHFVL